MGEVREKYRKLPGRRRGFLFGSSVWLGADHLLLVKSSRFREDYKRFYFRDIQAIVKADGARYHISTRSAVIAVLCVSAFLFARGFLAGAGNNNPMVARAVNWGLGALGLLLVGIWAYISARHSCRCRIYTAVSSDELPSLYRTWTARRFLEQVEPYIIQAQGAIEGNWAEAVEEKQVGPIPEGRVGLTMPGGSAPVYVPPESAAARTTTLSTLFVGCLCVGGVAELATLRLDGEVGRWILLISILVQLSAGVAVVIQNYMGRLRAPLRNLAIIALVSMGAWYYAVQIGVGMAVAYQNAKSKNPKMFPAQAQSWMIFQYPLARGSAGAITLLLGLAGIVVGLRGERPPEEKVSFNV